MKVIEYIKQHGLESLNTDFGIKINEYDDIVVLNYNQIESPKFHPICDECRALILEKGTWKVLARSFTRFFNVGEGIEGDVSGIRLPTYDDVEIVSKPISEAKSLKS